MAVSFIFVLNFLFFLQCQLSFIESQTTITVQDNFPGSILVNSHPYKLKSTCDKEVFPLTLEQPYLYVLFERKVGKIGQFQRFLGTVIITNETFRDLKGIGMSGYSEKEIPIESYIVISSSSFKGIQTIGHLHQQIIRLVFTIDRNELTSLLWCVSFKIHVPERNRNTILPSRLDVLTNPIDEHESSLFVFVIAPYLNELSMDPGTYIGENFLHMDGIMQGFPMATPSIVNVNSLLHSLNLPEDQTQQPLILESSRAQNPSTSNELGSQNPVTSGASSSQNPTTPGTSDSENHKTSSDDENQCKHEVYISSTCAIVKGEDGTQFKDEICVSSKSKCDEETIQLKKKGGQGKGEGATQKKVKEVKKEEEEEIFSKVTQEKERGQENSAFTFSVSLLSILVLSQLFL
ncbi:hypothetical protein HMI55_003691 [Coelomomyces lativittatus]|nr:hypothetical protein HMI55_003691 [Coelomomyces lativittatus]